ncbi:hypothetical protein GW866_06610 [bacterium]|nr:hypothetical protein [bacterium]OIO88617.1 MAG: hypothetical protein AUK02_03460 [Anaerolineae bacterium CG2_30_58_95]PIW20562.1 MAG: hypothetical protein COW33_01865 [Anaerolineae bacterium CG17_big_fil_post_rev_8_21_14_2_50_57_27]PJH74784.1 MAG: hypothetical protein CO064_10170 [Anaerolineae bacterium CG_4_9_14_0_8_um_filter_58_9]
MNENKEIERLRKIADKLATLDLHIKTQEEIKAEIQAMQERAKSMSKDEIEKQFDEALIQARAQAEETGITDEDIDAEIRAVRQIKSIKEVLAGYEKQYDMSTIDFFRKYISGETGDDMDFVEWASLAQMLVHLHD